MGQSECAAQQPATSANSHGKTASAAHRCIGPKRQTTETGAEPGRADQAAILILIDHRHARQRSDAFAHPI